MIPLFDLSERDGREVMVVVDASLHPPSYYFADICILSVLCVMEEK